MTERTTAHSGSCARTRREITDTAWIEQLTTELFGEPTPGTDGTSIYARLCALHAQCDERRGDFSALAPSPALDRCLSRLVEILRSEFMPGLVPAMRGAIATELCRRIAARPSLLRKARTIRQIAALAEAQMEHYFSDALAAQLGARGVAHFREALAAFPYTDSYAHLVRAELVLLHRLRVPLRTIALCGCGPLPLTALMLERSTGARCVLIDSDHTAVGRASALIRELERTGAVPAGRFEVRHADAGEVSYGGTPSRTSSREHVACDALVVTSLVPLEAKLRIAQRVRESRAAVPLPMLVRSAEALCAMLAYEPVPTGLLADAQLEYLGRSVPRHQVSADTPARDLLAIADWSVLNTSSLYYRKAGSS